MKSKYYTKSWLHLEIYYKLYFVTLYMESNLFVNLKLTLPTFQKIFDNHWNPNLFLTFPKKSISYFLLKNFPGRFKKKLCQELKKE